MNPISEFDTMKYDLIRFRRLTPASQLEGIMNGYGYNAEYRESHSSMYTASHRRFRRYVMECEKRKSEK